MSNKNHPLIELLNDAGYGLITNTTNYNFYKKLKEALSKDGKQNIVDFNNDVPAMFFKPMHDTEDLFQGETYFVHALIENYAVSVTSSLSDELNALIEDDDDQMANLPLVRFYLDGDLLNCTLQIDMTENTAKEYASLLDDDGLKQAKRILADWSNTCEHINDIYVLEEAINNTINS